MPYFPTVEEARQSQQVTDVFLGYNHNMKIGDGEFYDMENLTSDYAPLFANRAKRGTVATLTAPSGLLGKAALAYIDGSSLYYAGANITSYLTAKGIAISTDSSMLPKQLVSMGAYIILYPDKIYLNTENYSDCGLIEAAYSFTASAATPLSYTLSRSDGDEYDTPTVSSTEPANPSNGDLWMDTSAEKHVLKQYSSASTLWTEIPTVYVKLSAPGIGQSFAQYDGVELSGLDGDGSGVSSQIRALNGSKVIYGRGDDFIVIVGLLDQGYRQESGTAAVKRAMPDVDYLTEAENRLWGCKYGLVNGKTVNEIYASALGDFKNWNQFLGLSTDSYAASVGTDGKWTGAVTHLGYPVFFKEDCLHKVYISSSGAHQIVDTACRGVQDGCSRSLVVVNETLFYKSRAGVCAYDGSLPVNVSDALGSAKYFEAAAGTLEDKYYISMRNGAGAWNLFVLDTKNGLWHREDDTHALCFARCGGELYYIDADDHTLMAATGSEGEPESAVRWSATTGLIGYNVVEQKYVSRFNLRMRLPKGSHADMFIMYDSDGEWHDAGHMDGVGTNTFLLPVRPRRCDHFAFKIQGTGDIRIYSFAKILEVGSDGA